MNLIPKTDAALTACLGYWLPYIYVSDDCLNKHKLDFQGDCFSAEGSYVVVLMQFEFCVFLWSQTTGPFSYLNV